MVRNNFIFPLESILGTIFPCGNKTQISTEISDSKDQTFLFGHVNVNETRWAWHVEKSLISIFFNEVTLQRDSSTILQQKST